VGRRPKPFGPGWGLCDDELAGYLPWLAALYGIRPWEVDRLTLDQWLTFRDVIDQQRRATGG
jgi:hypothetical protein